MELGTLELISVIWKGGCSLTLKILRHFARWRTKCDFPSTGENRIQSSKTNVPGRQAQREALSA